MKIGFVFDDNLDRPDGVQQYISTLGTWLEGKGHEVKYLVSNSKSPIVDPANVIGLSKSINIRGNKNTLALPLPAKKSRINKVLADEQFDILHVQMPYSPLLSGKVIQSSSKEKLVGTFHIVGHGKFEQYGSKLLATVQRRQYKRFKQIISVSTAAKAYAAENYGLESVVIPNVFDINKYTTKNKSIKNMKILFMGRLVERKGCLNLLKAIKILSEKYDKNSMSVTIAGRGPQLGQLKEYVNSNNLGDFVEFIGFVAEEEKAAVFSRHNIGVFPSTGGESFGIILLEAMAAVSGVVIAGDNLGYATVMDKKYLFDRFNPESIANSIESYYKSDLAKISREQFEHAKQYDVAEVGNKIVNLYKKL